MRIAKRLTSAVWLLTYVQSGAYAAEVTFGREYLSIVTGPAAAAIASGNFEIKSLAATLMVAARKRETPAAPFWAIAADRSAALREVGLDEWRKGQCGLLDYGPWAPASLLAAPRDSAGLNLNGHTLAKTGPVWLGYLTATNGSYIVLFSTDARRVRRPAQNQSWAGEAATLESRGQVFVDIYRVADGARIATAKYPFTGEAATWTGFWIESRTLVVAYGDSAILGSFPALPAQALPFLAAPAARNGLASSCFAAPDAVRVTGVRDEGVDDDHNGRFESIRVIAKVEAATAGACEYAFELADGRGRRVRTATASTVLASGVNEIAALIPASDWRQSSGPLRLTGIHFTPGPRSRMGPFTATPASVMRTSAWAAASLERPGSRYVAASLKVSPFDSNRDGLFDGLDIELVFLSEQETPCALEADLYNSPGPGWFASGRWVGDLKRGPNRVVFRFYAPEFVTRLQRQPYYLNRAQTACVDSLAGPVNPSIKLPPIDFSRFKNAHCFGDENKDGIVDDADLQIMLREYSFGRPVDPGTDQYNKIFKHYELNRGCRTR